MIYKANLDDFMEEALHIVWTFLYLSDDNEVVLTFSAYNAEGKPLQLRLLHDTAPTVPLTLETWNKAISQSESAMEQIRNQLADAGFVLRRGIISEKPVFGTEPNEIVAFF